MAASIDQADTPPGRAVPALVGADRGSGRDGREIAEFGAFADRDVVFDHAGGADRAAGPDADPADDEVGAFDADVGEIDLAADAGPLADLDQVERADLDGRR